MATGQWQQGIIVLKNATGEVGGRGQSLLKVSTSVPPPQVCKANLLDPLDGFDSYKTSLK